MIPRNLPSWLAGSLATVALITLSSSSLQAAVDNWTGANTGGDFTLPANWSLGTTPGPADDAVFPATTNTTAVSFNAANLTLGSLDYLKDSGTLIVRNNTATATDSILTLGSAGHVNIAPGASANDLLYVASGGTVTFNNTNGGTPQGTGILQLALGRTGDFNIAGTATVNTAVTGAFGINKTGIGTLTLSNAGNTFSGGLTIKAGAVVLNPASGILNDSNGGTGLITLGDSANSGAAATLHFKQTAGSTTYANNIATIGTGVNTLNVQDYYAIVTGGVTLGANLVLSTTNNANSTLNMSGAFTGTGNLTTSIGGLNNGSNITLSNSVNMVGSITNNGTVVPATLGTLANTLISGTIGSNVTTVTQNSVGSQLTLNNASNAFTGGLIIRAGTVSLGAAGSQGALGNAILLGDGSGLATTLNATTSGNYVNAISVVGNGVHNLSATSNSPTFSGAISLNSNNLNLISNNNSNSNLNVTGGVTGTGDVNLQVLGTNTGSRVTVGTTSINNTGTVTNNGTGVGIGVINAVIGTNVTGVIQDSLTSSLTLTNTANTFTSGIQVKAGTLTLNSGNAGTASTGGIVVGDSANTGRAATLNLLGTANLTYANAVSTTGTGTATINQANFSSTLSSGLTLGTNTILSVTNTNQPIGSALNVTGAVTGTGNVSTQLATGTSVASRINLSAGVDNLGSFTNEGAGAGITTVSGVGFGANVTQIVQNSATSNLIISGANTTFTGNTIVTLGTLQLASTGGFTFAIGANGVNNSISGTGTAQLDGKFTFNLAAAAANGSWNIVDAANLTETYGAGFAVNGFTKNGTLWTQTVGASTYTYDQTTGVLSAIPEPSAFAMLGLGVVALSARRNRKRL